MKKLFILLFLLSAQSNAEEYKVEQPFTAKGARADSLRLLADMSLAPDKYQVHVPYHWTENMTSAQVMTEKPLRVIDNGVLKLSEMPEVQAWVDQAARIKYDNFIKQFPAEIQKLARLQVEAGNAGLDIGNSEAVALFKVDKFSTYEEIKKIRNILDSEIESLKKWPSSFSSNGSVLANECQLDVTFANGQKITVFGSADEVGKQLNLFISKNPDIEIKSASLIRINRFKMEAMYELLNGKNGKVFNFNKTIGSADYAKYRNFNRSFNADGNNGIKAASKISSWFGKNKSTAASIALLLGAGAAVAGQESSQAEAQLNSGSKKSAPKIKSGTGQ